MIKVQVQWGSKKLDLKVNKTKSVADFLKVLQSVTGVPVDRQKLSMRRKNLNPEEKWKDIGLQENTKMMLIGTAELPPEIVPQKHEESGSSDDEKLPSTTFVGLRNCGNTGYMNSILQVLRTIPEIIEIVTQIEANHPVIKSLASFFVNYPSNLAGLVTTLRQSIPLFNEKDPETESFRQQDASEAWSTLLAFLKPFVGNRISDLFGIQFLGSEPDDRLRCFIDENTRNLEDGINPEKIMHLPKYIVIQMMRFCYRKDEKLTAKIVRNVKHPKKLDVSNWVVPELKPAKKYALKGIITHKGRYADSGHYVAHVNVNEHWIRYDDEKVTEIEDEDVDRLSGGSADWHCSFLYLYQME